jgi:hypothetical protein
MPRHQLGRALGVRGPQIGPAADQRAFAIELSFLLKQIGDLLLRPVIGQVGHLQKDLLAGVVDVMSA